MNVPIRNSGVLLSSEFTAVLGHVEGRWQCPLWHALPSQFPIDQTGDLPGVMTASETHVWGMGGVSLCPGGKAWLGHTPRLGCSAVLPVWAQHVDQCPREENCGWPEAACPPSSCSPGSGGVRTGPDQFQVPPAWVADVSCTALHCQCCSQDGQRHWVSADHAEALHPKARSFTDAEGKEEKK